MQNYRQNLYPSAGQISNQILCRPFTPSNKGHNRAFSDKQNLHKNTKNIRKNCLNFQGQLDKTSQVSIKRPLISPCRTNYSNDEQRHSQIQQRRHNRTFQNSQQIACVNHPNKGAQFTLQVQSQQLGYCKKCAVKLASQGFTVSKITSQALKRGQFINFTQNITKRQLPKIPQYESNTKYKQILQFLLQLQKMQAQHLNNMSKLTKIDSQYDQQIRNTELYYSELLLFIQKMRDDHLSDLQKEKRRDTQIAFIQHDYLRQNYDQMNNIWNDIQQNLDNIVQKMEEEQVKSSLRYYKEKVQVYRHKIEEMNEFFDRLIILQNWEYQQKLERVQDFLMKVWISEPTQNAIHIPNISQQIRIFPAAPKSHPELIKAAQLIKNHNINSQAGSKPKNQKSQQNQSTAFQEQKQKNIITSPQFKQI